MQDLIQYFKFLNLLRRNTFLFKLQCIQQVQWMNFVLIEKAQC